MRKAREFPVVVLHDNHYVSALETTPYLANDEPELLASLKAVANDERSFDEEAAELVQMAASVGEALTLMGCRSLGHDLFADAFFDGSIAMKPVAASRPKEEGGLDA